MNTYPLRLLILLCVLILTSCSSNNDVEIVNDTPTTITEKAIEADILNLVNNYRIANGYTALHKLNIVKSQTYDHTSYMIDEDKISHDFFYDRKTYLIENANATQVGENVAYGYSNAEAVVNAWIKSDGHKKNIEGNFTHFNISAEKGNNGKWYFTNIFIKK